MWTCSSLLSSQPRAALNIWTPLWYPIWQMSTYVAEFLRWGLSINFIWILQTTVLLTYFQCFSWNNLQPSRGICLEFQPESLIQSTWVVCCFISHNWIESTVPPPQSIKYQVLLEILSRFQQRDTPDEKGQRLHWPKHCENSTKDENSSSNNPINTKCSLDCEGCDIGYSLSWFQINQNLKIFLLTNKDQSFYLIVYAIINF